ncbi:MAG: GNAT family N-acetyltransferase [Streptosporangiaceae bacterium]
MTTGAAHGYRDSVTTSEVRTVVGAARGEAERAARVAGVRVVALTMPQEVRRVLPVVETVWGPDVAPSPDILRALAHAGAVLLAAEDADDPDRVVGFALGFLGWADGVHLHSHQVGVRPDRQHGGVGYALKLAQRATCLEHGVTEMRWTYDPLLARNAAFNFGKLGVVARAFLPDFYGQMTDAINASDASDRFEVSWRLDRAIRPRWDDGTAGRALVAVDGGAPHRTDAPVRAGARMALPRDYHTLRTSGDPLAAAWREVARTVLADCYAAGLTAVAFGPHGYRFARKEVADTEGADR